MKVSKKTIQELEDEGFTYLVDRLEEQNKQTKNNSMIDITINYTDEFQIAGRGLVITGKFNFDQGLTPELLEFLREQEIPVNIHGKGMHLITGIEMQGVSIGVQNGRNYGLLIRKIEDANTKSNEINTLLSELENLDGDEVLDRAMKIKNK